MWEYVNTFKSRVISRYSLLSMDDARHNNLVTYIAKNKFKDCIEWKVVH